MKLLRPSVLIASLFLLSFTPKPAAVLYRFNHENVLGTSLELKVKAATESAAEEAEQQVLLRIDQLNDILSTYNPNSEVSRWQQSYQQEIEVSDELFEVMTLFDQWQQKTGGALNASAAIAGNLWQRASRTHTLPDQSQLRAAVQQMSQPQWKLDREQQLATHLTRQPIVLNTFVKSYILEKAASKALEVFGVYGVVLNIGGDIVMKGGDLETVYVSNPKAPAENEAPLAIVPLQNQAIATSGNYKRGFNIDGQWYSHILDARTAMPVTEIVSATVIANEATNAGALATAFNILTPQESAALASTLPDVEYLLVARDGTTMTSPGWSQLHVAASAPAQAEKNEVTIDLELTRFEGRSRRPFVAVWVENKKKEPVRTIALWFNKPRWLPDLKKWFSQNQPVTQDQSLLVSVSSATRSAGKYTLTWDGTDAAGNAVPKGKYTIYIEVAREHGTYQLLKQEIEWNGKARHFDLKGGIEVTSASIDLHTKSSD